MSLVIGVLCDEYVLLCGDTQINYGNGNKGLISKVFKLNKNLIWGFTGNVERNMNILSPYLTNESLDENKTAGITFDELCNTIENDYYLPDLENYNTTHIPSGLSCFIACYKNNHFILQRYSVIESHQNKDTLISEPNLLHHYVMGVTEHEINFCKLLPDKVSGNFPSIDDIVGVFQNVLDIGIEFDPTINNCMEYVYLDLGDKGDKKI